jgi:mediator of RNA polymerase II transcription subunit 31
MSAPPEENLPVPPTLSPEREANKIRFETELEFVQCLANPHYLASLASQGLLAQSNFVAYLKYLTYWLDVDKGFARFIVYEGVTLLSYSNQPRLVGIPTRCII